MRIEARKYQQRQRWTAEILNRFRITRSPMTGRIAFEIAGFEAEAFAITVAPMGPTEAHVRDALDKAEGGT
jgi:hypothetical protein